MDKEWTDLTLRNRTCLIGHLPPPRPLNQKWIVPQNPKLQLPLTYETPFIKGVVNFPKYGHVGEWGTFTWKIVRRKEWVGLI